MKKHGISLLLFAGIVAAAGLACGPVADGEKSEETALIGAERAGEVVWRVEAYEIQSVKFAFYKIPAGLERAELIEIARKIHEREEDTQLILVDDVSGVPAYVEYVRAYSRGELDKQIPKDWADAHIVGNVQKYINGRWVLCEGYGFEEIADVE